ncbi:MAG: MFS transporter [Chloroflexi bacterium]|nr:MFS transporter [Chloroflexota bacterium]
MPFFILGLMLPVYGKQIGASVVEIGLFFSAFSLVTVLLRPLVGWGLDHAAVARAALSTGQAIGVQATCEHPQVSARRSGDSDAGCPGTRDEGGL